MAIYLEKKNSAFGMDVNYHRIIDIALSKDENEVRITLKEYADEVTRKEKDGIIEVITINDKLLVDKLLDIAYTYVGDNYYKGGEKV